MAESDLMELPTTLSDLAQILQLRKSRPYNLLLSSTISLTPQVLFALCGSSNWSDFCEWMRRRGLTDRKAALETYLSSSSDLVGYRALAKLLKAGYFSTVLTTNVDSYLDDALFDCGLRPNSYETLVINRDADKRIAAALDSEPDGFRIIKLRGSLSDDVIPDRYPELFEFRPVLRDGLERYLNRDIVIIGSIEREDDIRRSLAYQGGRIYYAIPGQPETDDDVIKAIRARGIDLQAAIISGTYGHFDAFFPALETLLLSATSNTSSMANRPHPLVEPGEVNIASGGTISPQLPPESVESTNVLEQNQELAIDSTKQEKSLATSSSSLTSEKVPVRDSDEASDLKKTSSSKGKVKQEEHTLALVRILATTLIVLPGLGGIFFMVSMFSRNTPSFSPGAIIILLIIAAVILLGIAGIINSEQITKVFTLGISATNGSTTKSQDGGMKSQQDKQNNGTKEE